jgi:hypothetical protein
MSQRRVSVVREADERVAPLVFVYIACAVAWLGAVLSWVYYFRGYA